MGLRKGRAARAGLAVIGGEGLLLLLLLLLLMMVPLHVFERVCLLLLWWVRRKWIRSQMNVQIGLQLLLCRRD